MPRLEDTEAGTAIEKYKAGTFVYSGIKIEDLEDVASEFTIVTIVNDRSGSVFDYKADMEACLEQIRLACQKSPRSDFLLVQHMQFGSTVDQTHGLVPIDNLDENTYKDCLVISGATALYDATCEAINTTSDFAKKLMDQHYMCNGIIVILTDGCENDSSRVLEDVKKTISKVRKNESLESLLIILVGVGYDEDYVKDELDAFAKDVDINQFISMKDADAKSLAKLAAFISSSVSSQSQSLGSGGPSVPLAF
jgi:uncharacterized protein YegL